MELLYLQCTSVKKLSNLFNMRCIFPLLFLICQVQSFTQEELDELFPYFMEKMESRFVPESDFIPVRKKVIDLNALMEEMNPMLQHHSGTA